VPTSLRDVLTDEVYSQAVPLGPWDVKILTEEEMEE
jgi:beta-galactosidase